MRDAQLAPPNRTSGEFDADWYRKTYPDVEGTGLTPHEHYEWLGRRLNRPGRPPTGMRVNSVPVDQGSASAETAEIRSGERFCNAAIERAVTSLCSWALPSHRPDGETVASFKNKIVYDFLCAETDEKFVENPNGRALVELVQEYSQDADLAIAFNDDHIVEHIESILLVSYYAPSQFHAGGLRLLDIYSEIRARHQDAHITLFAARHSGMLENDELLGEIFDEMHFCDAERFGPIWIREIIDSRAKYDLVDLQFHQAGALAGALRPFAKRLLFTPMEALSRFDFEIFQTAALAGEVDKDRMFSFIANALLERAVMRSVDMTVCVSVADAEFLAKFAGSARVSYFPTGISKREFGPLLAEGFEPQPASERPNRLVFAAYFGSDTNLRGLEWYLQSVHPLVLEACPDYTLAVVGRGDTSSLAALADNSVHFVGEVPNLAPVMRQAKAGLVLALFGSGFRGKIIQYAVCGLPSVSTPLGATGLSFIDGKDILLAAGADNFASACVRILKDGAEADMLATNARKRAMREYTWDGLWDRISAIYGLQNSG